MIYDVITLFPEIIEGYCSQSITKRGIEKDVITVNTHNPRDFSKDKHKRVDDTPYGGGDGMVLMCQPIFDCYNSIDKKENFEFIMLTPQGEKFSQKIAKELSQNKKELSIGDFVLTGGELPALVLIDSISRNIENYLGCDKCADIDSFSEGLEGYLEYPHYTKPREYNGMRVPDVLLSGNHQEIEAFRKAQSLERTKLRRPDLLN